MSETKKLPVYPPISEYLTNKHRALKNDYRTEDGKYLNSCTLIACDIAKLFLENGGKPSLINVSGEPLPNGVNRRTLIPKIYKGRVEWGGHVVCANGDVVFDPMVGKPISKEGYAREVFTSPAILEEVVSPDFIAEFVQGAKQNNIK